MIKLCPKCKSNDISFSTASEENRGAGEGRFLSYIVMVLLLFIPVLGWILLIAMFTEKKKPVPVTYALCSKCGYSEFIYRSRYQKENEAVREVSV